MKVEMILTPTTFYKTRSFSVPNERWATTFERAGIARRKDDPEGEAPEAMTETRRARRGRKPKTETEE